MGWEEGEGLLTASQQRQSSTGAEVRLERR